MPTELPEAAEGIPCPILDVCECVHARVDSHVSACVYMWEPCVRVCEFMRVHGMRVCAYVSTHLC